MSQVTQFSPADVVDLASQIDSVVKFRSEVLYGLRQQIGFDRAAIYSLQSSQDANASHSLAANMGMDFATSRVAQNPRRYDAEISRLFSSAMMNGGIAIDTEVFGRRGLLNTAMYSELIKPQTGRSTMCCFLVMRGQKLATIFLGRSNSDFGADDGDKMRRFVTSLALAEMSYLSITTASDIASIDTHVAFTPREKQLIE